jgi:hypothetical protein
MTRRPASAAPATPATPRTWLALASLFACCASAAGCAGGPPAWDKSLLAKPEMTMAWNPLADRFDQHVYESKEGASGGYGVGGGGCGCY